MSWFGKRNYYHGFELFWTIADDFGSSELTDLDFEGWKNHWSDREDTIEETAVTGLIQWAENWGAGNTVFSNLTPLQLQMEQGSDNQQDLLASDGSTLGANLERLPAPPQASDLSETSAGIACRTLSAPNVVSQFYEGLLR